MGRLSQKQIERWAESKLEPEPDLKAFIRFLPYENLTPVDRKVLAVNTLPYYLFFSNLKKAEAAGTSESMYYRIIKKPAYQLAVTELCQEMWQIVRPEIQGHYLKIAKNGDRVACERILEQAGLLDPPAKSTKDTLPPINILVINQQRQRAQRDGLERFGYSVVDNSDTDSG